MIREIACIRKLEMLSHYGSNNDCPTNFLKIITWAFTTDLCHAYKDVEGNIGSRDSVGLNRLCSSIF